MELISKLVLDTWEETSYWFDFTTMFFYVIWSFKEWQKWKLKIWNAEQTFTLWKEESFEVVGEGIQKRHKMFVFKQAQKWDNIEHKYYPYTIPEKCILHSDDINEETQCAECSSYLKFGESYTSKNIHNHFWLWYPVCETCYLEEVKNFSDPNH